MEAVDVVEVSSVRITPARADVAIIVETLRRFRGFPDGGHSG
jgi:hypothetical protein